MRLPWFVGMLAWLLASCAWAGPAGGGTPEEIDQRDKDELGLADVVIVGTVVSVTRTVPEDPDPNSPYRYATPMCAQLRVDRVIKGQAGAQVLLYYLGGINGLKLAQQEQRVFLLRRGPGGLTVIGREGTRDAARADRLAELVAANPLTVRVEGTPGPFLFGRPVTFKVSVTNTGKRALKIGAANGLMTESYFYAPRLKDQANFRRYIVPGGDYTRSIALEPGATITETVGLQVTIPQAWEQLFTPDTCLQTPFALRVVARTLPDRGADGRADTASQFAMASPWVTCLTGYAPPQEEGEGE